MAYLWLLQQNPELAVTLYFMIAPMVLVLLIGAIWVLIGGSGTPAPDRVGGEVAGQTILDRDARS